MKEQENNNYTEERIKQLTEIEFEYEILRMKFKEAIEIIEKLIDLKRVLREENFELLEIIKQKDKLLDEAKYLLTNEYDDSESKQWLSQYAELKKVSR